MNLKQLLNLRIAQLGGRKLSIEAYLRQPKGFIGKKYTKEDLMIVNFEIEETEAAINGIKEWQKQQIVTE